MAGQQVTSVAGADHPEVLKVIVPMLLNLEWTHDPKNAQILANIQSFITNEMNLMRNGDEIASLVYGGVAPTPALDPNMPPMPPQAPQASGPMAGKSTPPKPQGGVNRGTPPQGVQ